MTKMIEKVYSACISALEDYDWAHVHPILPSNILLEESARDQLSDFYEKAAKFDKSSHGGGGGSYHHEEDVSDLLGEADIELVEAQFKCLDDERALYQSNLHGEVTGALADTRYAQTKRSVKDIKDILANLENLM